MFNDGDPRAQENRMHRARAARSIVDIQRIDSDQQASLLFQIHRGGFGQERVPLKVSVRCHNSWS